MQLKQSKKGFTIIEVVIVLAIAGLIFAIVFWALPNLQRNQRDNTRRQIVSHVMANLEQHSANNNSRYPSTGPQVAEFLNAFYNCNPSLASVTSNTLTTGCDLEDPIEGPFSMSFLTSSSAMTNATTAGSLWLFAGFACGDSPGQVESAGLRAYSLMVKLENGLSYCTTNAN